MRRDVRGGARAGEDVDHEQVDGAREARRAGGRPPRGHPRTAPGSTPSRTRQFGAHEVDEILLELDHLLPRSGPRGLEVARKRERPCAEVHGRDRFAGRAEHVDHVAHALHVLEEQAARILDVHVRLRCAVDHERERPVHPPIWRDHRREAAQLQDDGWMLGHTSRLLAACSRSTVSGAAPAIAASGTLLLGALLAAAVTRLPGGTLSLNWGSKVANPSQP